MRRQAMVGRQTVSVEEEELLATRRAQSSYRTQLQSRVRHGCDS